MPARTNGSAKAGKVNGVDSPKLRSRTNGHATTAPSAAEVAESKKAHATIVKAQNTEYDHRYGHVDMRDEQIIGGGKERALQKYTPGIIISETGKVTDKKLDEHHE